MKTAKVIIGGGYGDEGKGLFTDYLSARADHNTCVARFNGGAQAGHTVETADGKRHVFSHFSSGSFAGLPTFLSSFYVCSPITFLREREQLLKFGLEPDVYADETCPVTTPYDMMINQIVEQARGAKRHGSVGVGFGETLERQTHKGYALSLSELANTAALRSHLDLLRQHWVPARLAALGVATLSPEWTERLHSDAIREHYIEDVTRFLAYIKLVPSTRLAAWDHIIFEGAQGLLLDQDYGAFPHVTRSNTGLKNVVQLAKQVGLGELDVYYLTRSYVTRHGAGPMSHELPEQPYVGIIDKTNRPHPYQGSLRFGWLDLDVLCRAVKHDMSSQKTSITLRPHLAMSCLDQIDQNATYILGGETKTASPDALLAITQRELGATASLASYGPTRETIRAMGNTTKRFSSPDRRYRSFESLDIAQHNLVAAVS